MKYISTRDPTGTAYSFQHVVMTGLSPDGGLFVPEEMKVQEGLQEWVNLPFPELAQKVMSIFIDASEIPTADLAELTNKSYTSQSGWESNAVTPLIELGELSVLEQFHGPTCAFKDVALQFLGNLFEYFLAKRNEGKKEGEQQEFITVLGATSGDTGGAAIYGLRGKKNVSVCILHPSGGISAVQEMQMTSVMDPNVYNVAVEGNFDDCQAIVKSMFNQRETDPEVKAVKLGAVNSINWARILAQIVYYFSGYHQWLKLDASRKYGDKVTFVVPTGNFGNALAGYYARQLGLPIGRIVVATNANDILHRFISEGDYTQGEFLATSAPAMDITIPSNFERYLFDMSGRNGAVLASWMEQIKEKGTFAMEGDREEKLTEMRSVFSSARASDEEIHAAQMLHIKKFKGYTHCPHTCAGVHAIEQVHKAEHAPYILMATAHHGKFGESLAEAATAVRPKLPERLESLDGSLRRLWKAPNSVEMIKKYLITHVAVQPKAVERQEGSGCGMPNQCRIS